MGDFVLSVVFVILETKFFKLASLLKVIERLELICVEGNERHRKIRVVCNLTNQIDALDLSLQAAKSWVLIFGNCEKIRRFLHRLLQLFELLPIVIKLTPISQIVHISVEIGEKVVKFASKVRQVLTLSLKFHLA